MRRRVNQVTYLEKKNHVFDDVTSGSETDDDKLPFVNNGNKL